MAKKVTLEEKLEAQNRNIIAVLGDKHLDPKAKVLILEAQREFINGQFDIWIGRLEEETVQ